MLVLKLSNNSQIGDAVKKRIQGITWGSQWGGGFYGVSANVLALLPLSVNFFQLRLTKKLKKPVFFGIFKAKWKS